MKRKSRDSKGLKSFAEILYFQDGGGHANYIPRDQSSVIGKAKLHGASNVEARLISFYYRQFSKRAKHKSTR